MDQEYEMPIPIRTFEYSVAITSGNTGAEIVQLLAQVMDSYCETSDKDKNAIALWFSATYGSVKNAT